MRVSLDGRFLGLPGIGRHVSGLWRALAAAGTDLVALSGPGRHGWLGGERFPAPGPARMVRARPFGLTSQLVLPGILWRGGVDVHHACFLDVPYLSRVPVVMTVYDLFPYRQPANARSWLAGRYYRAAFPLAVRKAAAIVAISSFAAREVTTVLGVPEGRVHVVEPGIDHLQWRPPRADQVDAALSSLGLPRPYLLYVGTAKRHKNLATLLAALHPSLPPLVLAGPTAAEVATAGPLPEGCRALGRVPDRLLPALYAGASAVALPSLYEALGFTALEAMACGTPLVSSDGGGLAATVGDAGVLVAATDVGSWREALERVCGDQALSRRLVAAGRARVAARDWAACAQGHLAVYRSVC